MSKGRQLWPGDEMLAFFRAHIRRATALEGEEAERLAAALTKAVNRMLVWEMPEEPPVEKRKAKKAAPAEAQDRHDRAENFNPYLFSALVTLSKQGRDGLMARLEDIESAEHLRVFAEAQHVPVDASLNAMDDIREAIVAAVERRLADRKAAAS